MTSGPGDDAPSHRRAPGHSDGPMAFIDDLDAPTLSDDDHHHLARVLRVRDGESMVVCDGRGGWRTARFSSEPHELGEIHHVPVPTPRLVVAFALIKGDRPEMVVQKLTELGVDRIVPFTSDHGVVRWNAERSARQHQRFERIAREASMQCRRTHLPDVTAPTTFAEVVSAAPTAMLADADGRRLWEAEPVPAGVLASTSVDEVTVLIGPEGGWSAGERGVDRAVIRIADHVLRAETASIAAATLLTALRASGTFRSADDDNGG